MMSSLGGMPKHKKLLATLAPLVQEVKSVLADPSPEQKQQVGEKIAQAAQANQELFDNLRGKLKKGRVEEVERVMKPSIYSNQYMFVVNVEKLLFPFVSQIPSLSSFLFLLPGRLTPNNKFWTLFKS